MPRSHSATEATWRPSFAFGGRHFLRPSLRPCAVLAPSSPRRTMAAMADLLLRRAPAASGEVYDVLRGRTIVGRIMLSNGSAASQWVWTVSFTTTRTAHRHTATRLPGTLP
jgi:hypothetical protein